MKNLSLTPAVFAAVVLLLVCLLGVQGHATQRTARAAARRARVAELAAGLAHSRLDARGVPGGPGPGHRAAAGRHLRSVGGAR